MFGISAPGTHRSYNTKRFDKPQPDESATDEKSKAHEEYQETTSTSESSMTSTKSAIGFRWRQSVATPNILY